MDSAVKDFVMNSPAMERVLTHSMTLLTADSIAKNAVSARFAMVENAKRALGERIAMENGFTHLGILPTAGNAVSPVLMA